MKTYVVGGAVRDELLGLPVKDRDHVVVGATPEEMVTLGYKPVGKDFPVFLHPETHEEYALARTERKSGRGYKGFTVYAAPDVTLEDDLRRRDLTINAIAKAEDGTLIDPFNGEKDLQNRVLRHVSDAFAEDPVRILRVARFAARFGFSVHETTAALMRKMVESGETDYLVPERVWQEFSKGLMEERPERMFEVLEACGLRERLLPELETQPELMSGPLAVRFALLAWSLAEDEVETLCRRLRVPNERARSGAAGVPQSRAPGAAHRRLRTSCSSCSSAPTLCAAPSASPSCSRSRGSPRTASTLRAWSRRAPPRRRSMPARSRKAAARRHRQSWSTRRA